MPSTPEPGLNGWLAEFVADQSKPAKVDAWVERTGTAIFSRTPEIADDAVLTNDVLTSLRAHWLAFLSELPEPARELRLVTPAAVFAHNLAHRGVNPAELFRVYRVAQREIWQIITEVVTAIPAGQGTDNTTVLVFVWGRVSTWIDASIEASVAIYQAERERISRGAIAQRLDIVNEALAGNVTDARELSAVLGGYPFSGFHTAFLLSTEDHERVSDLDAAALRLARALGSKQPLTVVPGGREQWCWVGTRKSPDLKDLQAHLDWLDERSIEVFVGTPSEGLEGFRLSHREARAAQKIGFRVADRRAITTYPDVEVLALMAGSEEEARRFVARTLGRLTEQSEGAARLRQTVQALLSLGSVDEAAKQLSVHKNTVRYRVAQAEELLGFAVTESPTEVDLALRYFTTFLMKPVS